MIIRGLLIIYITYYSFSAKEYIIDKEIIIFKTYNWGGISLNLWSEIKFYGDP